MIFRPIAELVLAGAIVFYYWVRLLNFMVNVRNRENEWPSFWLAAGIVVCVASVLAWDALRVLCAGK